MNNQWFEVNETTMPCNGEVLVVSDGNIFIATWSEEDQAWIDASDLLTEYKNVTHWMPLPALPAEVKHVVTN